MHNSRRFAPRKRTLALICLDVAALLAVVGVWIVLHHAKTTTSETASQPKTTPLPDAVACAEQLPTDVLVGQILMVGLPSEAMAAQAPIFRQYYIGGAVLLTSPADPYDGSIEQFKKDASNPNAPLLVATDEEGGTVQRFQSLGTLPSPAQVASTLSPAQAEKLIAQHGAKLKAVGVDMVLGPLADVSPEHADGPLGSRVFSSDPQVVSDYARAYVQGWQAAGLLPTLKHFPGMGSATANTDYQPASAPPLATLQQRDFIPYHSLKDADVAVMMGNQDVPGWTSGPASLSAAANKYLRSTLGYTDNLIITDSLSAEAIASTTKVADAVVRAIAAGNDMALIVAPDPNTITTNSNLSSIDDAVNALKNAVEAGAVTRHQLAVSVARKLTAQHVSPCPLLNKHT